MDEIFNSYTDDIYTAVLSRTQHLSLKFLSIKSKAFIIFQLFKNLKYFLIKYCWLNYNLNIDVLSCKGNSEFTLRYAMILNAL